VHRFNDWASVRSVVGPGTSDFGIGLGRIEKAAIGNLLLKVLLLMMMMLIDAKQKLIDVFLP
jgi:hypothetical protein